jgi:hypothetical protein
MATRIRTLNFLPEIFKTPTNAQFLAATLDQLVAQPNTKKIQGYVGSKFGYGVNATDYYVTEPTKVRTDYQLDPGVVFLKENDTTANDFISYPGIVDGVKLEGGLTQDNNRLFNSQFYSWDSFTNLDKIINFNEYYWLPDGPERVIISTDVVFNASNFLVQSLSNEYLISSESQGASSNPTLTLLRGGSYTFSVNQNTQFWIQGEPGVTGYSPTQPNVQTRNVFGVTNNGAENGVITFEVPTQNALNEYNFPPGPAVGVVSSLPFNQINGARVTEIGGIDGVTALEGLTVMFYNTGIADEIGYVQKFYDQTLFDEDGGVPYNEATDYPGTSIFYNNYEGGFYSQVNSNFYTITLLGDQSNPIIQLTPAGIIPTNQTITPTFGSEWVNRNFYRSVDGAIALVPYNSAILDTLYYQDGTNPNKVGIIKLVNSNVTNSLDVVTEILGKPQYTAPNGVVFTNGLKVLFQGNVTPEIYNNTEFYVEGVGTAIELIPVADLVSPGAFAEGTYIPFDTVPYDVGNYDSSLYLLIDPDYITIARNAINKNAWSRSNRWFHVDVINATANYNNNPDLALVATIYNKASRPIIEFYPNLSLFDSGVIGKQPIDFIDFRTTDAFTLVAGQPTYYPDVAGYTGYTATIAPVSAAITSKTATQTVGFVNQIILSPDTTGLHVNDTIVFGLVTAGGFVPGTTYKIVTPGDTDFTAIGASSNASGTVFVASGAGSGTGTAGDVDSEFGGLTAGVTYYINEIVGNRITISTEKQGTNVVLSSVAGSMSTSIYPYSTTITIATDEVFGLFEVNQYIADSTEIFPAVTFISEIEEVGSNTILTVSWYNQEVIAGTSVASIVSADTPLSNYALFDGARVVFAADTNLSVRDKIYVSRFSSITGTGIPVITLTEAFDGQVLSDEQTAVYRGYNYRGQDFYFNVENWQQAQQKNTINQAPRFDIYDENNISFGDSTVYIGTSFTGCTLFQYGLGTGSSDPILGFPLRYSTVSNVGDISFDVTLDSQTFNYVQGTNPITQKVNTGYVYNYTSRTSFVRQLGWQTAVSPSVQYQIFEFNWVIDNPVTNFVCDITPVSSSSTNWPTVQVYINNTYLPDTDFTVSTTADTTTVTIPQIDAVNTVIQVLILSDQVSPTAYYQIPINLSNNPFNQDITTVNIGDIRGQYQSIFFNNPDTLGPVFGRNNYRDLGNLVPWGNRIIQNSASLVLPGTFLRKQNHNLFNSILYNSRQYITFKNLLIDTVNNTDYSRMLTPAEMLDDAMDQITSTKTDSQPFFWSDMLPSKAPYISNTYSFANTLDVSIYPLSRIYDFDKANYYGVLVYLIRDSVTSQLISGVDYTVSADTPSLTITLDLLSNDQIVINEYNQTYGSYVPNTPTKLGLYPSTIPAVVVDTAYFEPTYFIVGHDGSYNKLFGSYDTTTGQLEDFRDQVLLEYETRVYNNLKLSNVIPIQTYEVIPGFFRDLQYSYDEFLEVYSESFLDWVGQNRVDYKRQFYNPVNEFSYNYRNSGNKINRGAIQQGYFRGLYLYYYDTTTPDVTPWQMIGYTDQPTWWTERYGPAPYTSDNLILWNDLAQGIDWNNGNPVVLTEYIRPELLQVLPVDSNGDLVSPLVSIVGNYNNNIFNRDWKVGDVGPTEFSYRRSSTWPFDLMRLYALAKPADFFNLAVDVDNYKYNAEFNQYLVNNRSHLQLGNIPVYGLGTPATSYINWIVDFEKQVGINATTDISTLLKNLDVRLVYRVAGFSDKNLLKFYVEKSSANATNSSLLIPDESYSVLLYDNQPFDKIVYSGVIIQITENGYQVYGNSQTNAYFKILLPKNSGYNETIEVENLSVKITDQYTDKVGIIPYGTEFYSVQEVAQFLSSYGKYLENQGMKFDLIENGIPVNWPQMIAEFLYWAQIGWEIGSITTINPSASTLLIDKDSHIVQPLTLRQRNFVLNQNLFPIQSIDLNVVRQGTAFTAQPLNQGDAISYGQFNISNFEHGIVFDNVTLFNDIIYNLITGLRQYRISVRGAKSADWNGTVDPAGFILNQDNIQEWNREIKYTKGEIVLYKNRYWTSLTIVQPKVLFDERDWKETNYNEIQKGLLPNSQTRSYESTLYYNTDSANLENDADLLSFSLIGYRPRDYLALADLTDITQVNVYKNMIKQKGTLNAASAFKGANLPQGGINYDIYENWAIKSGEYGGVLNNNFVEFNLNQSLLTGNPSIVGLTNGVFTDGVQQEVPLYSVFNYGRPITSPNILPTISASEPSSLFPTAGYVNYNDVKMSSYYYSGLATATNASGTIVPITEFYVRDYVWLADYLSDWRVYTPVSLGSVTNAKNNLNGTVTITFSQAHNLTRFQLFGITNFDIAINNYYLVAAVVDPFRVIINLSLNPSTLNIVGQGIGLRMQSQRVATAPEIVDLPLLNNEFTKSKVWVDENNDGSWAVYRKSLNYQYDAEIIRASSQTFGSAVAYTTPMGYLIGDADVGQVYRYTYNADLDSYTLDQAITNGTSFGSYISYADDLFVVSEPTSATPKVYVYQLITTTLVDNIDPYQTISAPGGVTDWGSATAISGDQNWLYISDTGNARVYAYRKSTLTSLYENVGYISVAGLTIADNFGYSISTDYYGDTVVIGAPDQDYNVNTDNYGYVYVFARTVQNFIVPSTSQSYIPQTFALSWSPVTVTQIATATDSTNDRITVSSSTGFSVNDPVVFSGDILSAGAISQNTVYYVYDKPTSTTFRIASTRDAIAPIELATQSGPPNMTVTVQTTPLFVNVNGMLLEDDTYAVIGSTLYVYSGLAPTLNAGDILSVSGSNFVLTQTLDNGQTPRIGVQFGQSLDTNTYANEILVGAPFELNADNYEGSVHRFTNGGEKYGFIIGTEDCNITTPRTILINGYQVILPIGDATSASNFINAANIPNVSATTLTGKLVIQLVDIAIGFIGSKLSLTVLDSATPAEMGIDIYTATQTIACPHLIGSTQFGSVIKFNEFGSFIASAPTGTRYSATTFDFTDDELDNDTVFDNNATQWIDTFTNAGAVYMFDYISAYNESLNNPGKFVYAQSTNAENINYGSQPYYGQALDFNDNRVTVGTPNFRPGYVNGQVVAYTSTSTEQDWAVYRSSAPVVDINGIANIQLFSASSNTTLDNLDYFDPLQGKLLGAIRENIDVISNSDPAAYNSPNSTQRGLVWGADKVGQLWFNTSNTRFVNYHQNDIVYNSAYWGRIFSGSDVAVYSWVVSNVNPLNYIGPGTPYNIDDYTVHGVINAEGTIVPLYYFWVRNTNIVFEKTGKTLADSTLEAYISQPQNTGISYFSPLQPDIFALYNVGDYLNGNDTVLHIGYATGTNDDPTHNQYELIRADYADDFLPGLPGSGAGYQQYTAVGITEPISLYNRMLDSMCGVDNSGAVVPNPFLPKAVQTGVLARPRQSFFYDRYDALKNYLQYANEVLAQFPITEIRNPSFLNTSGITNPSTVDNPNWSGSVLPFYDTTNYWSYINWWAPGYDNNTKSALQVPIYADLSTLNVTPGTIVTVATNGNGNSETYIYGVDGSWTRIGLENGTIEFSSALWDYSTYRLGFGDNFFDTRPYDEYPSEETRYIIRSLNEEIYTNELLIFRNKSLILLFEYIQSETSENQNYLPWLNKTSFLDVSHTIRELRPIEVFQSDNELFLEGYMNEVKPYHVVIKEFLFKYTGIDVYEGDITDFDLPAQYNSSVLQFITPELVYSNPNGNNQFLPDDPIWQTAPYSQWFNNHGVSIVGENDYPISVLTSYIATNSNSCYVDNVTGFPVTGTILIGTELIGYSSVDLLTNQLLGLARGVQNTVIQQHIPGEIIFIDLPAVLVLNTGRLYDNPPKITAVIDTTIYPEPTVPAQFEAIMGLGTVIGVNVINPGQGYAILPKIVIDPSVVVEVNSTQVNIANNTIELTIPTLQTGDLIVYYPGVNSTIIGGLSSGQKYYVNLLEVSPAPIIALYASYIDAIRDHNRVFLNSTGSGVQKLNLGAVASCVTSSVPVRENNITLRFDRNSYTSQIIEWQSGNFYGSFYAGSYSNSDQVSSSSIALQSTQPPIDTILAGAQGATFEILDASNDQTLTWSSRTRETVQTYGPATLYPNAIRINPSTGGSPVAGELGSTVGFYIGMPVKFVGATVGNLVNETTYYVKSLVDLPNLDTSVLEATGFTISATVDENGVPGSTFVLTTATIPAAGLPMYVGEVINTALLTINYSGIRNATTTTSGTNTITVLLTATGQNGTNGLFTGIPVYFTGDVFGGISENEIYYVTSITGPQTFTMSTQTNPTILTITETDSVTDAITCDSTLSLSINEPIVFTGDVFGNIVEGTQYYIRELFSGNTTFSISETINGPVFALSSDTGSFTMTSQKDTVTLQDDTGSMTMNVSLPISPGQINGQLFSLYPTSQQYINQTGTVTNLIERDINATLATVNRLCLSTFTGGILNLYVNFEFDVASNIGGLTTSGGPYTVTATGTTTVNVTNTSGTGNWLTVPLDTNPYTTDILYSGMQIIFSGVSLGGVLLNTVYYVDTIDASPPVGVGRFTISETSDLSSGIFVVTNDNGDMVGTGDPFIQVADVLTNATGPVMLTQTVGTTPTFAVSYILGGYRVTIQDPGAGYAIDNTITILGTNLGGTTTANDLVMTVSSINATGGIVSTICNGTPAGTIDQYYFKVVSENQVEVYENAALSVPVSGQNFPYTGITSTTATIATASNDRFTVTSSADFGVNDPVFFTGNVFGGVTLGQEYYILSKPTSTTVTISETVAGTVFNVTTDTTGSMTMAKSGDYTFLPEPFYFSPSIVKYNNRVYQCIVSNNDPDFILGKWELLEPGSRKLNGLDRVIAYYNPTVNMPGVDLTQLVTGITYPNSTYLGNAFAPDDEFTVDVNLTDQPFYPTGINLRTIIWNGVAYLAGSNTETYSSINLSETGSSWIINKISNQSIGITDLLFAGGSYVLTSNNSATPILISDNGFTWISNGTFTPFDSTPYDITTFDISSVNVPSLSLNGVTYYNGIYIAVGNNIISSTDLYSWTERYAFTSTVLSNVLNAVAYVSTPGYTGFIAVGLGQRLISGVAVNVALIFTSTDGFNWNQVSFTDTIFSLNAIASNSGSIVTVGDNGVIYASFNAVEWFAQTSPVSENLNDIIWDSYNNQYVAVGDNGTILTGDANGNAWTAQVSGTTEDIQSVVWNNDDSIYIVVGLNNTILQSADAITWVSIATFEVLPSVYDIQGDAFTAGYGPEEMVPGVVSDTITMTVATRPGTNWDETVYQHVGYNVVSIELSPVDAIQTEYSFINVTSTPAQLSVFVIDYTTELSTTIYQGTDYTIDWINKVITLTTPLSFVTEGTSDRLRIDVYEVGNGDQLVKANTETDPIRLNVTTGFQEIYVNANYSADIYQGSGIIRPSTNPLEAIAVATSESTDAITCESVENFVLNGSITFSGAVFGGIVEDQVYYVKSISYVSNRITISEIFNVGSGTAGATFPLTNATGSMTAIIQVGTGTVWTTPSVFHNGTKLVLGHTANIIRTKAGTNTITTNTTGDLVPNISIKFSSTMFGGIIVPLQTYYIKTIYDANEFTISETPGGAVLELTDATGGAIFVSGDYAIGIADNGITASVLLANEYDTSTDYITYTFFGETLPVQYGYTIPEVQTFTGDGSTASFTLTNYIGDSNVTSSIVEINGVRQTISAYTISSTLNTILFNTPPSNGSTIAVTSYNLTDRQYFNTQYGITGSSGATTSTIVVSDTVHSVGTFDQDTPTVETFDQDTPSVVLYDQELDWLTLGSGSTSSLSINFPIVFQAPTLGGLVAGQIYYVVEILNSTDFVISTQVDGLPTTVTTDSGTMNGVVNGLTVANIVNINNAISSPLATVLVTGTIGGASDYVVCGNTIDLIVDQPIIFKAAITTAGSFIVGQTYKITTLTGTSQVQWNTTAGTVSVTYAIGDTFTAATAGAGTGQALITNLGGINTLGEVYFVRSVVSGTEFTIKDQYGTLVNLTTDSGSLVGSMGGLPAISVTTGIDHNLSENEIVRIDGTLGSVQLNNNTYYAKIVTDTEILLYDQPYNPALNAVNYPVTFSSTYISGGYVWLDGLFTVSCTNTISTSSTGNRITVNSTDSLIPNTPVYFTSIGESQGTDILGNILAKTEYYVLAVRPEVIADNFIVGNEYKIVDLGDTDWNTCAGTVSVTYAIGDTFVADATDPGTTGIATGLQEFTITENRFPDEAEVVLTNATGSVDVSQFQQVDVDRLWVTINGYRVPSSLLRINEYNNLSILSAIGTGDEIIITSMMPTATPNENVYLLNVTTTNQPAVYRANTQTRTWLTQPLSFTDEVIYLNDATRVTDSIVQEVIAPAPVDGKYNIGLEANKNVICHVTVYNNTTSTLVDPANFEIIIVDLAPILQISDEVNNGDSLTIDTLEGRLLFINGEQIAFAECDIITNTVSGLTRGANGTGEQTFIPKYSEVFGIIPNNRMTNVVYGDVWNSYIYNPVDGDPLQISQTTGANFLKVDRS